MSADVLNNKVALITGASSGIGLETARMMAGLGASVALVARRRERLQALQREIVESGGDASVFTADVASESEARAVTRQVVETYGRVDILVNSAGIIRPGTLLDADVRDLKDTIEINLLAPMYMSKAVLEHMLSRGEGHVVTVSSNAAKLLGSTANNAYCASKHGVTGFSNSLRKEVAAHGIRVTLVEPGTTETEIATSIPDPETRRLMDEHIRKETVMQAGDVAAAICYAVSQHPRVNVDEIWLTPTRQ